MHQNTTHQQLSFNQIMVNVDGPILWPHFESIGAECRRSSTAPHGPPRTRVCETVPLNSHQKRKKKEQRFISDTMKWGSDTGFLKPEKGNVSDNENMISHRQQSLVTYDNATSSNYSAYHSCSQYDFPAVYYDNIVQVCVAFFWPSRDLLLTQMNACNKLALSITLSSCERLTTKQACHVHCLERIPVNMTEIM